MTLKLDRSIWWLVAMHLSGGMHRSEGWRDWCAVAAYRDDALVWC